MPDRNLFTEIFQPDRLPRDAILYEHRTVTYDELRELTIHTAKRLKATGLNSGERVAILLNDSPEFIASFVAIISLGAIAVPINMALRKEDHLFILNDCGARIALVEADAVEKLLGQVESPIL